MSTEYPYQLVAFIDNEPKIGEPVYGGENGWYPQIALKRRFKAINLDEEELFGKISEYIQPISELSIPTKELIKPSNMPVRVLEVENTNSLRDFHLGFISFLEGHISSRYPERDGENYFPHVTAEYWGKMVIDVEKYSNRTFKLHRLCLLKDEGNEDSLAYRFFDLS